jgi:hypothetical protein
MKRVLLLMMGGAVSLLVGTAANAVTTEQVPTDPLIPMLVTRVRVDEMAVATPPPQLVALPNAHRVHAEAFQRRAARVRPVRARQRRAEGSSRQSNGL